MAKDIKVPRVFPHPDDQKEGLSPGWKNVEIVKVSGGRVTMEIIGGPEDGQKVVTSLEGLRRRKK